MGLETAEILLAVEKTFKIDIWDDIPHFDTFEDLVDSIEQHTHWAPHNQEEADRQFRDNFQKLQTLLAQELGVFPSQWTPETPTASLFKSIVQRRRVWKNLEKQFFHTLPPLYGNFFKECYGGLCVIVCFLFGLLVAVGINVDGTIGATVTGILAGIVSGMFSFIFLYCTGFIICSPLFFSIPRKCRSLGGLTTCLFRADICLDSEGHVWTREAIEGIVLNLVSDVSGTPVAKLSLSQRFGELF